MLNTLNDANLQQSINSPTSSQGSLGSPNRDTSRDQRRVGHIHAEQKRRYNIKNGFDMLHSLIPQLNQNPNAKVSFYCNSCNLAGSYYTTWSLSDCVFFLLTCDHFSAFRSWVKPRCCKKAPSTSGSWERSACSSPKKWRASSRRSSASTRPLGKFVIFAWRKGHFFFYAFFAAIASRCCPQLAPPFPGGETAKYRTCSTSTCERAPSKTGSFGSYPFPINLFLIHLFICLWFLTNATVQFIIQAAVDVLQQLRVHAELGGAVPIDSALDRAALHTSRFKAQ